MSSSSPSSSSISLRSEGLTIHDRPRLAVPVRNFSNAWSSKSNPPYLPPRDTTVQWIADSVNGTEKYRVTIHIDGFYPNEVHSRVDGSRLHVYGEHIENRSQGMSRRILEKSYELPSDVDQYRPHVTFPSPTSMQIEFPSRITNRVVQRSHDPPRYSKPRLIHRSENIIRHEPSIRTTYVQRSNKVLARSDHRRVAFDSTDSSLSAIRSDSSDVSEISQPVRVRSRTPTLSMDHQRSLLPLDFDSEQFYRSEFRPHLFTDRHHGHHIRMKLDLERHDPDDLRVFINDVDLIVQILHTPFYRQITLPSNTDFSSISIEPQRDGQLHITADLLDKYSSAVQFSMESINTDDAPSRSILEPYLSLPTDADPYTQRLYANLTEIKEKINADEIQMIFVAHRYEQTGRIPWQIMSRREKWIYLLTSVIRMLAFLSSLYIFIVTLDLMTSAFTLLSRSTIGRAFRSGFFLKNPIVGVMSGILITTILQSSSTVTSIIVSMVGSGIVDDVRAAIPMIMGANIGTSITNTLVAFGQLGNRNEFARSFSSGVLMDVFNYLTTLILLPLEVLVDRLTPDSDAFHRGGYLARVSGSIASTIPARQGMNIQLLNVITKPLTRLIIELDGKVISSNETNRTVGKIFCPDDSTSKCSYLFRAWIEKYGDHTVGLVLLLLSLLLLTGILVLMVKLLKSLIIGMIDDTLKKILHIQSPGWREYLLGYVFILVGIIGAILVQSSSVFCSILTPLVGLQVLALERNYELTIGANIGTTITAILASLTQAGQHFRQSVQIALTHFLFNLSGCVLWYVLPSLRRIPLRLSRRIGQLVSEYRWFALFYVAMVFFLFPLLLLLLALIHWLVAICFLICLALLLGCIALLNYVQATNPERLPRMFRSWAFLPRPCRSLSYWDHRLEHFVRCLCCRRCVDLLYPLDHGERPLKEQYLNMRDQYLTALDHRFLTHTHQLNQVFEKHHAPVITLYPSRNPIPDYVQDFYRTLVGRPTHGQRALSALVHLPSRRETNDEEEELIDRVIVFDRSKTRENFENEQRTSASF